MNGDTSYSDGGTAKGMYKKVYLESGEDMRITSSNTSPSWEGRQM